MAAPNRIRELRKIRGLSLESLAERMETSNQQVSRLETGRRRLTIEWMRKAAKALEVEMAELLVPPNGTSIKSDFSTVAPAELAPYYVVGEVQAGSWRETLELPPEEWEPVLFGERPEYRGLPRFGLRVRGPSMNALYPQGTVLDCIKFIDLHRLPRSGDRVIVQRHRPEGLIEATAKELRFNGQRWELWPRSHHPAHQSPVVVEGDIGEDSTVEIYALIIGSYQPE
jgi:transcriptional regulator with XRE-family HTH domain